jgi:hypothetical protein
LRGESYERRLREVGREPANLEPIERSADDGDLVLD